METNRTYYVNDVNLKAQIAALEDGRFCLTRYSYPDKISHNAVVEQHITDTIEQAENLLDAIYTRSMRKVDEATFLESFKDDDVPYNFNQYNLCLSNCRIGWTQNIVFRLGRKLYYMDIFRNAVNAHVCVYNYVSKDRSSFSKYDERADYHDCVVTSDAILTRDFIEHIPDIEKAQAILNKYRFELGNVRA